LGSLSSDPVQDPRQMLGREGCWEFGPKGRIAGGEVSTLQITEVATTVPWCWLICLQILRVQKTKGPKREAFIYGSIGQGRAHGDEWLHFQVMCAEHRGQEGRKFHTDLWSDPLAQKWPKPRRKQRLQQGFGDEVTWEDCKEGLSRYPTCQPKDECLVTVFRGIGGWCDKALSLATISILL
jgi:hypothetical protein